MYTTYTFLVVQRVQCMFNRAFSGSIPINQSCRWKKELIAFFAPSEADVREVFHDSPECCISFAEYF